MTKQRKVDFQTINHGSLIMLVPLSKAARVWVDENIAAESYQRFGDNIAIEARYAAPIVAEMIESGLRY